MFPFFACFLGTASDTLLQMWAVGTSDSGFGGGSRRLSSSELVLIQLLWCAQFKEELMIAMGLNTEEVRLCCP